MEPAQKYVETLETIPPWDVTRLEAGGVYAEATFRYSYGPGEVTAIVVG